MLATKYHWTIDYIMWGVSMVNIQMMMIDSVSVYYGGDRRDMGDDVSSPSKQTGMNFSQFMSTMHSIKDKQ